MKMEQEDVFIAQGAPGTPLQQMSQGRFNQLRLQQSPVIPAYVNENQEPQSRRGSEIGVSADVKSKIAFLNQLSGSMNTSSFAIASSPTRSPIKSAFNSPSKTHSRANSTVSMPSNPAELTNMVQTLHSQLEQSRNRERLVAERVESLMEQLQSAHSRSRHEQKEGDKEVKAMKKQVHKAELALIRCQQELQEARNEQEGFKARAEHERQAKERSRKESFERARTLAGIVEELEVVKREKEILLSENEALKAVQSSMESLNERQSHAVGLSDMSVQTEPEATSIMEPKGKRKLQDEILCSSCGNIDVEDLSVVDTELVQDLREELDWARSQLKREQDLVHMMNMQCQFRACPCRLAENAGLRFVHDHAYDRVQKERAISQGLKRKAEDELPIPKYITLRESLEQTSRVREAPFAEEKVVEPAMIQQEELANIEEVDANEESGELDMSEANDPTLRALPTQMVEEISEPAGVIPLDEAADIPLPSPRSDDLEPTLLLEDMTQVMVEPEPAATAKHFAFSTSTSSRKPFETDREPETPVLRQSHSAVSVSSHDDLFDIRPPRHLPPRPSTVMGLRTIASPIRMVPPSPDHRDTSTPATSPPQHRTMQIPLKDSPLKNAITHRRSNSRPRERSRARSPTPGRNIFSEQSPSTDTYFPVTPKQKTERPIRPTNQLQASMSLQTLTSQSTTTRVPLRGLEDEDDAEADLMCDQQSKTQPLNIEVRGRQPLHPNDPNTHSHSAMLPGTPITREAALAQIRARRDRARSVAMRKQADEENGRVKTPKSAARRGVLLNRDGMARDISNLSQASAPARF